MPRQNYMTISVHEVVQQMFDEFTREKQITKTDALSDMLEMYMIAKDEDLYFKLKKKYLRIEGVKQMLSDRDSIGIYDKEKLFIFMKLGNTQDINGKHMNGAETMQAYINDEKNRGYTWFSTQSLYYGMSEKHVNEYNNAIKRGKKVILLFGIGKNAGGSNDIDYMADVLEIYSNKLPTTLPSNDYPSIWHGEMARIWIKINNIQVENVPKASNFKITSTDNYLEQVIKNSQYHFGYISFKNNEDDSEETPNQL